MDTEINEMMRKYTANPILVIIDVNPKDDLEIPTDAYCTVDEIGDDKSDTKRTFVHLPSEIGAFEAEEVGVEHLLRDIRVSQCSGLVDGELQILKQLLCRITPLEPYQKR